MTNKNFTSITDEVLTVDLERLKVIENRFDEFFGAFYNFYINCDDELASVLNVLDNDIRDISVLLYRIRFFLENNEKFLIIKKIK